MRLPRLGRSITVVLVASAAAAAGASAQVPPVPAIEPPPLPVPTVEPPALPPLPPAPVPVPDVPEAPDLPAPLPDAPDAPAMPAPGGGAAGATGPAPRGGSDGTAASGGAGSAASGGSSAADSSGTTRRPSATAPRRRSTATAGDPQRARPTPRERRLRHTVARLSDCLAAIRPGQRRVLVLRAGLGAADAHSRAAVAERLDLALRIVRRTERRGIRALRAAARRGCVAAPRDGDADGPRAIDTVAFNVGADRDQRRGGGATATATGRAGEPGQGGVKEEFRSGPGGAPGATLTPPSLDGGGGPPLPVLIALAFLAGFAAVWAFERRRA